MNRRPPLMSRRGAGFTLVELLVAATIALVIMAALASLFAVFSRGVSDSQELVRLTARMRSTAWRLRQDLQGATAEVRPLVRPEAAAGYLEIIEGPLLETGSNAGDPDDMLMLTTASPGRPFTGLIATTTDSTVVLESDVAEVAWFCKQGRIVDGVRLYDLYRRQLLVTAAPGVGMMATTSTTAINTGSTSPLAWDMYFRFNDLSVRREGNTLVANSLADLTRRHARFMHNVNGVTGNNVPSNNANAASGAVGHTLVFSWPQITTTSTIPGASDILTGPREGEDLILADVTAFDIRVFDPQQAAAANSYVDLGSGTAATTLLASTGNVLLSGSGQPISTGTSSGYSLSSTRPIIRLVPGWQSNLSTFYDTWSAHTESNALPDRVTTTTPPVDQGTNWADDNANGVVDDAGELEQPPPYNVPLRGVEIRLRCYEPSSKQVRQVTIQHSFLAR